MAEGDAARFCPQLAYILILLGLIFSLAGAFWLGILFCGLMVLFSLSTMPVEIDASRRGFRLLRETGLMQSDEDRRGSSGVLTAAATTYLAAAITAVLQFVYLIRIVGRRR